jgi:hypothetical protein
MQPPTHLGTAETHVPPQQIRDRQSHLLLHWAPRGQGLSQTAEPQSTSDSRGSFLPLEQ